MNRISSPSNFPNPDLLIALDIKGVIREAQGLPYDFEKDKITAAYTLRTTEGLALRYLHSDHTPKKGISLSYSQSRAPALIPVQILTPYGYLSISEQGDKDHHCKNYKTKVQESLTAHSISIDLRSLHARYGEEEVVYAVTEWKNCPVKKFSFGNPRIPASQDIADEKFNQTVQAIYKMARANGLLDGP